MGVSETPGTEEWKNSEGWADDGSGKEARWEPEVGEEQRKEMTKMSPFPCPRTAESGDAQKTATEGRRGDERSPRDGGAAKASAWKRYELHEGEERSTRRESRCAKVPPPVNSAAPRV